MKIALAQMNIQSARCEQNFMTMKLLIDKAKKEKADIIVFPQLCISGTFLQDKWLEDSFCEYVHSFNERIKALSEGIGIVFGNLYYASLPIGKKDAKTLKKRYNAAFFVKDLAWVKKENNTLNGIAIKQSNDDTHLLSESRYFSFAANTTKLTATFLFEKEDQVYKIAIGVGENTFYSEGNKVDFKIQIDTKPWFINDESSAKKTEVPLLYVNACGMQNNGKNIMVFDGNSAAYDENGKVVYCLNNQFKGELGFYDFKTLRQIPLCENKIASALTCAIQEFDMQMFGGHIKWIIGLSGGIDSSINAALLVKALGNKRVIGYNMASAYNSLTTKNNARILADALDIELREGSIESLDQATMQTIQAYGYQNTYPSLVYENIQARLRGHLLSTFASIENGVIINNANKIEVALGYCTLYGDAIGALSPLGDLTKVECFELANALNNYFDKEVISKTLIPEVRGNEIKWEMPPSAELKEAQLDPMKWFYHDEIIKLFLSNSLSVEEFMESYLEDRLYQTPLGKWIHYYHLEKGIDFIEDLEWVLKTMANASFKRIQMPPIVSLNKSAFGNGYRESQLGFIQSDIYRQLKTKIIEK